MRVFPPWCSPRPLARASDRTKSPRSNWAIEPSKLTIKRPVGVAVSTPMPRMRSETFLRFVSDVPLRERCAAQSHTRFVATSFSQSACAGILVYGNYFDNYSALSLTILNSSLQPIDEIQIDMLIRLCRLLELRNYSTINHAIHILLRRRGARLYVRGPRLEEDALFLDGRYIAGVFSARGPVGNDPQRKRAEKCNDDQDSEKPSE